MSVVDIELPVGEPTAAARLAGNGSSSGMYQQVGLITRQLHDALRELGVMPRLQKAAARLPDARTRLGYVTEKTGAAAERVLDAVERAQRDRAAMASATRRLAEAAVHEQGHGALALEALGAVKALEQAGSRVDARLLDIMVAQDFHDLTSQVVGKVLALAQDLEGSLVTMLLQAAPEEAPNSLMGALSGPAMNTAARSDVVASQGEVDDLLASLGF